MFMCPVPSASQLISHIPASLDMPFTDQTGSIFNCGFCRTLIYECQPRREPKKFSKKSGSASSDQDQATTGSDGTAGSSSSDVQTCQGQLASPVEPIQSKESDAIKVHVDVGERYQTLFNGSQFVLGEFFLSQQVHGVGFLNLTNCARKYGMHSRVDISTQLLRRVMLKHSLLKSGRRFPWLRNPAIHCQTV